MRIKRNANFDVADWIEEQEKFWKPVLLYKKKISYWNIFKNKKFKMDKIYNFKKYLKNYMSEKNNKNFLEERILFLSGLGIKKFAFNLKTLFLLTSFNTDFI